MMSIQNDSLRRIFELKDVEYKINRMFNFLGEMKLNDVYEYLNLPPVEIEPQ